MKFDFSKKAYSSFYLVQVTQLMSIEYPLFLYSLMVAGESLACEKWCLS